MIALIINDKLTRFNILRRLYHFLYQFTDRQVRVTNDRELLWKAALHLGYRRAWVKQGWRGSETPFDLRPSAKE
jgi:hypothetical protein